MAEKKKKPEEMSALDRLYAAYDQAASQGYLGAKAQVSTETKKKKKPS